MKLDICAPQVIFPDDFQSGDPLLVVVDLGRILLTNAEGNFKDVLLTPNVEPDSNVDCLCFACFFSMSRRQKNQFKNQPT